MKSTRTEPEQWRFFPISSAEPKISGRRKHTSVYARVYIDYCVIQLLVTGKPAWPKSHTNHNESRQTACDTPANYFSACVYASHYILGVLVYAGQSNFARFGQIFWRTIVRQKIQCNTPVSGSPACNIHFATSSIAFNSPLPVNFMSFAWIRKQYCLSVGYRPPANRTETRN